MRVRICALPGPHLSQAAKNHSDGCTDGLPAPRDLTRPGMLDACALGEKMQVKSPRAQPYWPGSCTPVHSPLTMFRIAGNGYRIVPFPFWRTGTKSIGAGRRSISVVAWLGGQIANRSLSTSTNSTRSPVLSPSCLRTWEGRVMRPLKVTIAVGIRNLCDYCSLQTGPLRNAKIGDA